MKLPVTSAGKEAPLIVDSRLSLVVRKKNSPVEIRTGLVADVEPASEKTFVDVDFLNELYQPILESPIHLSNHYYCRLFRGYVNSISIKKLEIS